MITVRFRILLLLSVLATSFLAGIVAWQTLERRQADLIGHQERLEKSIFFQKLLVLSGKPLRSVAYDYTYWDEMVDFVRTGDRTWASQNLDSALGTYDADDFWIYTPQMRLVYNADASGNYQLRHIPLTRAQILKAFGNSEFAHFFLMTRRGLLEVRGAAIHPSADVAHTGPAYGYFFVGRIWNTQYQSKLSALTDSKVHVTTSPSSYQDLLSDQYDDIMLYRDSCPGYNGDPAAYVYIISDNPTVRLLASSTTGAIMLFIIFALFVLAFLFICLFRWVTYPLRSISLSLETQRPEVLAHLQNDKTEFGALAALVNAFFEQKGSLVKEICERQHAQQELKKAHDGLEQRVEERTAELAQANTLLQQAYDATVEGWSRALDLRDKETEGHSRRVMQMSLHLAKRVGMSDEQLIHLMRGALLHDIGKMGVPDHILLKPGPLTEDEWVIMRRHPTYAYEMLSPIAYLRPSLDIPWCHHEKWDGTGYPRGLYGEQIPIAARLFALVDVWDALRSDRPYRTAWSLERTCDYIHSLRGVQFQPELVDIFLEIIVNGDGRPDPARLSMAA